MIAFRCSSCGQEHSGVPTFGWTYPIQYLDVPEAERADRVSLTEETCVIDDRHFFVRGGIEIPVRGSDDPLIWGAWVSLREENFFKFQDFELEPTDHPLAVEQREGISVERVAEIYELMVHNAKRERPGR